MEGLGLDVLLYHLQFPLEVNVCVVWSYQLELLAVVCISFQQSKNYNSMQQVVTSHLLNGTVSIHRVTEF